MKKPVDGQNIIYHYLQKHILKEDDEFSKELIEKFVIGLSIWLPPKLYQELPILYPYVVRDPLCRKSSNPKGNEEWGSSNSEGYFRDDNTLVKETVKTFSINSPKIREYDNVRKGKGFTASHIWREISIEGKKLASRSHKTYSFIPNLVWLPTQISKLSDREGSHAQKVLQTISHLIYNIDSLKSEKEIDEIWNSLPNPGISVEITPKDLNYFNVADEWINRRKKMLLREINTIEMKIKASGNKLKKVKCSRYLPSLDKISKEDGEALLTWLIAYKELFL